MLDLRDNLSGGLDTAKTNITTFEGRLDQLATKATNTGVALTQMAAPLAAGFGVAISQAMNFDEAVTNTGAVLGLTRQEIDALKAQLLAIGQGTRAGPQGVANAYYDIVGGVADASTHMAILQSAISTAQAGNADLGATTNALIAIMNSYGFSAEEAGYASDVLTRTVGTGVGTMDQFASALPQVAGLASSLGIDFGDLGAMTAFLTTKGNSASESVTQLSAMMTALLNPNMTMKAGLEELGFSSGQAAIENLGLVGAFQALSGTQTATTDGMAKMSGSVEALRGITSFAGDDVRGFFGNFRDGTAQATQAAETIQMGSAAAQFDLLKSSVSGLSIEVGTALLPSLTQIVQAIGPVISNVARWVAANPQAVMTVAAVTAAVLTLGTTLIAAGQALNGIATIVRVVTTPWGALLAAITAVIAAYREFQTFTQTVQTGQQSVVAQHGGAMASGQISQQQYEDVAFKAAVAQFGDLGARLMWDNPSMRQMFMMPYLQGAAGIPARDSGGSGMAGSAYMIGTGAQPELFIPSSNGQFVPNADTAMGGININGLTINANSYEGGERAAMGFEQKLRELIRQRGN